MDAVQQAKSGHPGTPMALAPVVYTLVAAISALRSRRSALAQSRPLRAVGRARVDAALLAAASGRRQGRQRRVRALGELAVTLDDIKRFRQLDSKCPGHPEYR